MNIRTAGAKRNDMKGMYTDAADEKNSFPWSMSDIGMFRQL
jgi:hypothetical protein